MVDAQRSRRSALLLVVAHLAFQQNALAWTPLDYVDPTYALSHTSIGDTSAAQAAIIGAADQATKHDPWSAQSGDTRATSGDPADYFSWSEVYFSDCANTSSVNAASDRSSTITSTLSRGTDRSGVSVSAEAVYTAETTMVTGSPGRRRSHPKRMDDTTSSASSMTPVATSRSSSASATSSEDSSNSGGWFDVGLPDEDDSNVALFPKGNGQHNEARKTSSVQTTTSSSDTAASTSNTTLTAAATGVSASSSSAASSKCTSTWSDRDRSKENDDLPGPKAMDQGPEGIFLNAVAYALTSRQEYLDTATSFLSMLFIEKPINPSAAYAGGIRGSDDKQGTPEGIMDFRGLVKVSNAMSILRQAGKMDARVESGVKDWSAKFLDWLSKSSTGRNASQADGHLATFYYAQVVGLNLIVGDERAAKQTLEEFFTETWKDQVDRDGKQKYENGTDSFEAGCLNLQGVITMAKIGSTLGVDYWHDRSSSTGTIKSAVDYLLRTSTGENDLLLAPHVAAVKAVYGDNEGVYSAFLEARGKDYKEQPWWFFDQPEAMSTASRVQSQGSGSESSSSLTFASSTTSISNGMESGSTSTSTALASAKRTDEVSPTSASTSAATSNGPVRRSTLEAEQADREKVAINLGQLIPFTAAGAASSAPSAAPSTIASVSSTSARASSTRFSSAPSTLSTSAVVTSAASSESTTTSHPTTTSSSTSSVAVFQTSPGPVPPSPPNDECDASSSETCMSARPSTSIAGNTATPTKTSGATAALIHIEAEHSAKVKVEHDQPVERDGEYCD